MYPFPRRVRSSEDTSALRAYHIYIFTVDTEINVKLIPPTYFFAFAFAFFNLLIPIIFWHDSQFKVNFIDPPSPQFSFAFAFVILR